MQDQASQQITLAEVAQLKPFWPDAPRDIFDYVLSSKGAGLWGHGYGAIVVSLFAQSPRVADQLSAGSLATINNVEQTTGSAPAGGVEMVCGRRGINYAEDVTKQVADALTLANDQQSALAELRSALQQAEEGIAPVCPGGVPASVPERLQTMQDRLWTMRVMATSLRAPLQKFYDALTDEQKAKLEAQPAQGETGRAQSGDLAMQCYASVRQAPQWPVAQITRAVRPSKEQQAGFVTLSEISSQMSQLMMGSCPKKALPTVARLDATLDWLDTMMFAGANLAVALDDFYRNLSDEQKARIDKIAL